MKKFRVIFVVFISVLMLSTLTSCGGNYKGSLTSAQYNNLMKAYIESSRDYYEEYSYTEEDEDKIYELYCETERAVGGYIIAMDEKDGKAEILMDVVGSDYYLFKGKVYDGMDFYYDTCVVNAEISGDNVKITDIKHLDYDEEDSFYEELPSQWQSKYALYMLADNEEKMLKIAGKEAAEKLNGKYESNKSLYIYFDYETGKDVYEIYSFSFFGKDENGTLENDFRNHQLNTVTKFKTDKSVCASCRADESGFCKDDEAWNEFCSKVNGGKEAEIIIEKSNGSCILFSFKDDQFFVYEDKTEDKSEELKYDLRIYNYLKCESTAHGDMYLLSDEPDFTYQDYLSEVMEPEYGYSIEIIMAVDK